MPSGALTAQALKFSSMKRRAAASSFAGTPRAASQPGRNALAGARRAQLPANAARPGAKLAEDQPGMAAKETGANRASAGFCVAVHGGQSGPPAGSGAQPAATRIANREAAKARKMWVIYLEMGVALALAILIVWWTWPRKRKDGDTDRRGGGDA